MCHSKKNHFRQILKCILGNESLVDKSGFGLGTCVIFNSGCMSHGSVGGRNTGLSKGASVALAVLLNPLKEDIPLDFSKPWYTMDVSSMNHLQLDILRILNRSVSRYFWVSIRVRVVNQGLGYSKYKTYLPNHLSSDAPKDDWD